jgi:hypothetical protein
MHETQDQLWPEQDGNRIEAGLNMVKDEPKARYCGPEIRTKSSERETISRRPLRNGVAENFNLRQQISVSKHNRDCVVRSRLPLR